VVKPSAIQEIRAEVSARRINAADDIVATFQRLSTGGFEVRAFSGSDETDSSVFAVPPNTNTP
jgi:hypothetical protein